MEQADATNRLSVNKRRDDVMVFLRGQASLRWQGRSILLDVETAGGVHDVELRLSISSFQRHRLRRAKQTVSHPRSTMRTYCVLFLLKEKEQRSWRRVWGRVSAADAFPHRPSSAVLAIACVRPHRKTRLSPDSGRISPAQAAWWA